MRKFRNLTACFMLIIPLLIQGQSTKLLGNITLGDALEEVKTKVEELSESTQLLTVENPVFPLASLHEAHLVCNQLKTPLGTLEKVVFTFGDSKLRYIEARGNAVALFTASRKDTASTYLDYSFYSKDKLVLNKKKDIAWMLDDAGMHLNLFTWENPYLNGDSSIALKVTATDSIPDFLEMGAAIDKIKPLIETHSNFSSVDQLSGKDPNAQIQINGFGVHYLGFPRKIEARFGNDQLNVVWILTGKEEEGRVRKALIAQFGDPIYSNQEWEIFNDWQVGLRKDKPEVLLMEKQIGLSYKSSYFGQ